MSMEGVLRAVALMGATGTGKSALAMRVALDTGASIVCCDSMQLYKGLDIGTAKPTPAERESVPHYMVDCCDLPGQYSAARWAAEARDVIRAENSRGHVPLIVGGTGFYLKALVEGFADIPAEAPEVRAQLEAMQQQLGTAALYERLRDADPEMAVRLKPNDTQRIMRALAVFESTGVRLSRWQRHERVTAPIDVSVFVLDVARELLRKRLAERFHAMMEAGWLDEVGWLDGLNLADTHPAMRAVGYRQLLDHLHGESDLEQAVRDGITATRRYAKRQVTWFAHQAPNAVHGSAEYLKSKLTEAVNA